ncbi:beta-ketoacyl-ACP reductase [Clostridia bacterium]|nr:beta-ketoacyl-ACP reductase [Clostridia bacterium]
MGLEGKVALVTGGGRGIGREICLRLSEQGVKVAANYSSSEPAGGGYAMSVRADVSDFSQCERMFAEVEEKLGPADILVNNAGITSDNLILRMPPEEFARVIGVNLAGTFHCTKLAARGMIKRRFGRIVNISSVIGLIGNAGQANYAASKAGVIALTKSTARELAGRGVTANAIAPGFIETDMTAGLSEAVREQMLNTIPQKRFGAAADVAAAAVFLCSEGAAYITGQVLAVDGGMTMGG